MHKKLYLKDLLLVISMCSLIYIGGVGGVIKAVKATHPFSDPASTMENNGKLTQLKPLTFNDGNDAAINDKSFQNCLLRTISLRTGPD